MIETKGYKGFHPSLTYLIDEIAALVCKKHKSRGAKHVCLVLVLETKGCKDGHLSFIFMIVDRK